MYQDCIVTWANAKGISKNPNDIRMRSWPSGYHLKQIIESILTESTSTGGVSENSDCFWYQENDLGLFQNVITFSFRQTITYILLLELSQTRQNRQTDKQTHQIT